jgi:hypothetical protein
MILMCQRTMARLDDDLMKRRQQFCEQRLADLNISVT